MNFLNKALRKKSPYSELFWSVFFHIGTEYVFSPNAGIYRLEKIRIRTLFTQWSLHLKNYSNRIFLCWKTKSPTFYCLKRKKTSIRPNKFACGKPFNGEFYWPNVFHYGFKIQSLTWTLHCRSQNLQPVTVSHLKNIDEFGF